MITQDQLARLEDLYNDACNLNIDLEIKLANLGEALRGLQEASEEIKAARLEWANNPTDENNDEYMRWRGVFEARADYVLTVAQANIERYMS